MTIKNIATTLIVSTGICCAEDSLSFQLFRTLAQETDGNLAFSPTGVENVLNTLKKYSAGSTRQGKNRNLLFENIHLTGRQQVRFVFDGHDATHKTSDVTVRNFTVNGRPLKQEELKLHINDFCENIRIEY